MAQLSIKQIAANRQRLMDEIRQREELLKAYTLVEKDLHHSNGQGDLTPATTIIARHRHRPRYGTIKKLVTDAIENMRKSFTIKDIHLYLEDRSINISVQSVTTVINRLREEDQPPLRVKRPGKGRRATIFEK